MAAGKKLEKSEIRTLRADEIECRVALVKMNGLSLLLYKDARVDQRILDETFSPFGWRRSHQEIHGSLFCTVEIKDPETGEWIGKQDVGTEGFTEKEKSLASDSFKRACFNWGIGRELYSAPFIWIPATKVNITEKIGKPVCNEHFRVKSISYNEEREISDLSIINGDNIVVYEMGSQKVKETSANNAGNMKITKYEINLLDAELKRTGVTMDAVRRRYHFEKPEDLTAEVYNRIMGALKKTATAAKVA